MNIALVTAFLVLAVSLISPAHSESYQLSGKSHVMTWPKGAWNGSLWFPNVYCATSPFPERAERLTMAMFNSNTTYVARIEYPDKLLLAVAFSSIPSSRSAEEDIAKALARHRDTQDRAKASSVMYEVSELTTSFGPTVGLRVNNIESDTQATGPFPLASRLVISPSGDLLSMSVHRLFARGSTRFEVAAIQPTFPPTSDSTEQEMRDRLTKMVEALTQSLQLCTGKLPIVAPR